MKLFVNIEEIHDFESEIAGEILVRDEREHSLGLHAVVEKTTIRTYCSGSIRGYAFKVKSDISELVEKMRKKGRDLVNVTDFIITDDEVFAFLDNTRFVNRQGNIEFIWDNDIAEVSRTARQIYDEANRELEKAMGELVAKKLGRELSSREKHKAFSAWKDKHVRICNGDEY